MFAFVALAGVLLGAFNVVLDEYAKGAIRAALEEGARAGATWGGSPSQCEVAADEALSALVRGPFADHVHVVCSASAGEVVASASGRLPSFLPMVPSLQVQLTAVATTGTGAR